MVTINQQRKFFNDFADNHFQLKDFGWGDVEEISGERATTYPLLWVNPSPWVVDDHEISFKYTVFCADRTYEAGMPQVTEVHSDTAQILLDLMASMDQQQDYDWELVKQASGTPFTDVWKDRVAGHYIDITFKVLFDYNECAIPTSGQPAPPPTSCAGAVVTINTILYGTVASGGSEDIEVRNVAGDLVGSLINGIWVVPNAITCVDATAVLKDTAGTTISTTAIASGDSGDITAPNATAVIKDSSGNTLKTEAILSNASENITINDSVAVLKNSLNTTILSENIRAEATENIPVADVSYTDSDGVVKSVPYNTSLVCTAAAAASGVLLQWPVGQQYTAYEPGDTGSRLQAGFYTYNKPAFPKVYAELDWSLGANGWARLKNNLIVGGNSNKFRYVDVDGLQAWGATNNKDCITIDKFTGLGIIRKFSLITASRTWIQAVADGLAFSVVVNGITYDSNYLISMEEQLAMFGTYFTAGASNMQDPISLVSILLQSNREFFWTSTTVLNNTANAVWLVANPAHAITIAAKTGTWDPIFIFDARSLITAP